MQINYSCDSLARYLNNEKLSVTLVVLLFGVAAVLNADEPFAFIVDGWWQEDIEVEIDLSNLEKLEKLDEEQIKKIKILMENDYSSDSPMLGVFNMEGFPVPYRTNLVWWLNKVHCAF